MSLLLLLATVHGFLSLLPIIILWMGNHSEVLDVDDLLVTGNRSLSIQKFVDTSSHHFSLKDLGPLSYFLGVEAISTSDGMFLSQHKYVRDLLAKFHLEGIKDSSTPMSSTGHLTLNDGSPPATATQFRSLIGGLQYLQLTRPDIAFAVNKLAQFMHASTQTHWTAAKRLLCYLKHTIHLVSIYDVNNLLIFELITMSIGLATMILTSLSLLLFFFLVAIQSLGVHRNKGRYFVLRQRQNIVLSLLPLLKSLGFLISFLSLVSLFNNLPPFILII